MPGLCEGHVTQRTVTGQGSDTEMGAALGTCGVWTLTHGPGIKYSCSIEQHQNVQSQYTLLCYNVNTVNSYIFTHLMQCYNSYIILPRREIKT